MHNLAAKVTSGAARVPDHLLVTAHLSLNKQLSLGTPLPSHICDNLHSKFCGPAAVLRRGLSLLLAGGFGFVVLGTRLWVLHMLQPQTCSWDFSIFPLIYLQAYQL